MKDTGASFNAQLLTAFLADEAQRPEGERLAYDPFAARLVDEQVIAVTRLIDRMMPDLKPMSMARLRYIDEQVEAVVQQGVSQVVFLGSRYETRPMRLPGLGQAASVKAFEVDHPRDAAWKKAIWASLKPPVAAAVNRAPFDLAQDDLLACLCAHGYDAQRPGLFVLEGVSFMLTPDEADAFFRLLAAIGAPGSRLLFTYVHPLMVNGMDYFLDAKQRVMGANASIEPITFGIAPEQVASYLSERGYAQVINVGSGHLKQRYFGGGKPAIEDYVALATIGKASP